MGVLLIKAERLLIKAERLLIKAERLLIKAERIEDSDGALFLSWVEVRISIPGLLDIGMTEPARDLLNIDAFIRQQRGVGVPEIVNTDVRQSGGSGIGLIAFFDSSITEARFSAAYSPIFGEPRIGLLSGLMFGKNPNQRLRHLQITVGRFIFRRGLPISSFQLLSNAPTDR